MQLRPAAHPFGPLSVWVCVSETHPWLLPAIQRTVAGSEHLAEHLIAFRATQHEPRGRCEQAVRGHLACRFGERGEERGVTHSRSPSFIRR